jgi:hypothetical protein
MERLELPEIAFAYARLQAEADAEADETERIKKAINAFAVFQFNKDMFHDGTPAIFLQQLGSTTPEQHEWRLAFNIGSTLLFAAQGSYEDNLEGAIYWLQCALETSIQSISPMAWARTQGELATAYKNRISGDKAKNLAKAHQCLAEALTVFTPDRHFKNWLLTIRQRAYLRLETKHTDDLGEELAEFERAIAELEFVTKHIYCVNDEQL